MEQKKETKRSYWIKLNKGFFDKDEIRIIEGMPGGKDFLLFYLKLLLEAVDKDGKLRFSDVLPYSEEMLAAITHTDVMVVKGAVRLFQQLKLVEVWDDGTYYLTMVKAITDSCADNDNANRQRRFREHQKELQEAVIEEKKEEPVKIEAPKKTNYTEEFERFWKIYPRLINKSDAYRHFNARISEGEAVENILEATQNYVMQCRRDHTDKKYIMHPSTFLGTNLRYRDYLKEEKKSDVMSGGNPFDRVMEVWQ